MTTLLQFKEEIKEYKTSWIQNLKKEELISIFEELQLSNIDQNIEDLRKTLRALTKSGDLWKSLNCQQSDSESDRFGTPEEIPIKINMNTNYGRVEPFNGSNFDLKITTTYLPYWRKDTQSQPQQY
jgi:predicted membrane protein